jgi:carboxypeptidase family protein
MTCYVSRQGWRRLRPGLSLLFSVSICLGACAATVSAQTTSTTILGAVTDSAGAVVAGAKVTVTNTKTGLKREVTVSSNGDFSFPLLDVGVTT